MLFAYLIWIDANTRYGPFLGWKFSGGIAILAHSTKTGNLMDWQLSVLQWLQQFRHPVLDGFFQFISFSAEETFYIAIAAWLLWCQNKRMAHQIGFAFLSSMVLNPTLKSVIALERPIGMDGIDSLRTHTATGHSFPSGHTQGAASFWTAIAIQMKTRWFSLMCASMIVLVALSRLYLGVHWPMDVLAGIGIGLLWVLFVNWFMAYAERTHRGLLWLLLLPFFLAYFAYPDNKDLVTVFGAALGFLAGMQLDLKVLNYQPSGRWWQKAVKFISGLAVLLLLKIGLKMLLPFNPHIADLIRYAIIGFWLSFGAPWVFMKISTLRT